MGRVCFLQAVVVQEKMPNCCVCVCGGRGVGGVGGRDKSEPHSIAYPDLTFLYRSPWAPACTDVENLVTRLTPALASQEIFATADFLHFSLLVFSWRTSDHKS